MFGYVGYCYSQPSVPVSVEGVDLARLNDSISLTHSLRFYFDGQQLEIEDIIKSPGLDWALNSKAKSNFGQSLDPLWLHFRLDGVGALSENALIKLDYNHLDEIDVFFVAKGQVVRRYQTGDTLPYSSRPFASKVFLFPFDDLPFDQLEVYLKAKTQGPLMLPLEVITRAEHERIERNEFLWHGAYFGILVMMFFYNLLIYLLVRDVTYLYYLFYVVNVTALQFTLAGFGFQYIWPDALGYNNTMTLIFTTFMPLSAILFVRKFLKLNENGKQLEILFGRLCVVVFVTLFIAGFWLSYMLTLKLLHTASMFAIFYGFYLGVVFSLRGFRSARIFALAWFVYLVFIGIYLMDIQGVTQPNVVGDHALQIGSLLELVLLSLSFGDKINEEKEMRLVAQQETLAAQAELNRKLDGLVKQRTAELEEANEKLLEISQKDPLTKLFNRRYFDELIENEWKRAYRDKTNLCVAMVDVDHFKNLNDNYGHQFGDVCLMKVAQAIQEELRRPPDVVARYGGEEFVILLPSTDRHGGERVAEKVRSAIESLQLEYEDKWVSLTASIGLCSLVPQSRELSDDFVGEADKNLYQAKSNGRNQVVAS